MDFISALRERGVPEEIEFDYTWLHVQGRYIVFDDKVADPTASFSSVEHLCVSRQSLIDTELFQFEWVPDQSKSEYDHHDAAMMLLPIAFPHAESQRKLKVVITTKQLSLCRDHEKIKSWSRENKTEKL